MGGASGKRNGFTIVELLIVIVVIAILATLSVVAYSSVQQRARNSAANSAASQAGRKLLEYHAQHTAYPLTGNLAAAGVRDGNGTTYDYSSDGTTFCLTASVGTSSYRTSGNGAPINGGCAGHSQGGAVAITNVHRNPSLESSLSGYSGPNGATVAQSSTRAHSGTRSVLVTLPAIAGTNSGVNTSSSYIVGTQLKASTTYMFSAWVYVPSTTVNVSLSTQGPGVATICPYGGSAITATKDSWVRINCTFTTAASGQVALYVLNATASTAGMQFYVDSVMVTEGASLYNYGDGDTANWIWNGTPAHAVTSTGPAP